MNYYYQGYQGYYFWNMNNTFKILNAGEFQFLKYKEYQMTPAYVFEWYRQMKLCSEVFEAICSDNREYRCTRETHEYWEKYKDNEFAKFFYIGECGRMPIIQKLSQSEIRRIAEYMDVIPFIPCVMFNISPAWKGEFGKDKMTDKLMIKNFQKVIDSYLNESFSGNKRYTRYQYCLECGSEGNFLHAHIVAEINLKIEKSVKTHINKGGHSQQLNKYWNNHYFKGHQGLIKGKYSIQRNLINTEEILKDKLKYLLEENKEEGHQNLRDLNLVVGGF